MTAQDFTWSGRRLEAAGLLAEDKLTDEQIAGRVGVSRRQLANWKLRPEFAAHVDELRAKFRKAVQDRGIAAVENRVDTLNEIWRGLHQVMQERGEDPLMADVAGGKTGLLVAKPLLVKVYEEQPINFDYAEKGKGDGEATHHISRLKDREYLDSLKRSVIAYEYAVDTGLIKEVRELAKLAEQQLGQAAVPKSERLHKKVDLSKLSTEQLERLANGDDIIEVLLGR